VAATPDSYNYRGRWLDFAEGGVMVDVLKIDSGQTSSTKDSQEESSQELQTRRLRWRAKITKKIDFFQNFGLFYFALDYKLY
jgi:hypothetical protein